MRRVTATLVAAVVPWLAAWPARAVTPGPPNVGLVRALDSVGENLFGGSIFGASAATVTDRSGNALPAVQIDLADHSPVPSIFNVFTTPGPPDEPACRAYLQVEVSASGVTLRVDPDGAPEGFELGIEFVSLAVPPSPCADGSTRPGGLNAGLLRAMDSIGANLLGRTVFGAGMGTVTDASGNALPAVRSTWPITRPSPRSSTCSSTPAHPMSRFAAPTSRWR